MQITTTAIVVAAGNGTRMKSDRRKPMMEIAGRPILTYCLDTFEKSAAINNIIVVLNTGDIGYFNDTLSLLYRYEKIIKTVKGGKTRQESVFNGLQVCPGCDIVLIHDGVRPFIEEAVIRQTISDAYSFGASIVGVPVTNTIKYTDENGFIEMTPDRERLWEAQTPQTFRAGLFIEACENAVKKKIECPDDACLMESYGLKVVMTRGNDDNIKITTRKDIYIAEQILKERNAGEQNF